MNATSAAKGMQTIDQFLIRVGATKAAADGSAPLSEPGSIGGETTHPTGKVDDRLQKPKEGPRSGENSKDVKDAVGAPSVESIKDAGANKPQSFFDLIGQFAKRAEGAVSVPGSATDDHLNIGLKAAPTGEDKSVETASAKAGKEDKKEGDRGGTTHPANTENGSIDGHKWAADWTSDTSLEKMAGDFTAFGNNYLADLHNVLSNPQQISAAGNAGRTATKQAGAVDANLAMLAGHELAGIANGTFDKQAAAAMVQETLQNIVKEASVDADEYIQYALAMQKAAEEPPPPMPGDPAAGGAAPPPPPGGGAMPPPPGGPGGAPGGGGADMLAALGGAGAGDPGAGGPPPGGEGGEGGGIDPQQLQMILQELNTTPEELMAVLEQETGGGAGLEEGGDVAPPPPGGGGAPGMETQASAGAGKGRPNVKRAEVFSVIQELMARSRAPRR